MRYASLAVFVGSLAVTVAGADDWPQFRGPDRNGISKEKGLLAAWPKGGPKLVWTFKNAGLGFSSVAVAKGVVYTLGTDYDPANPNGSAKDEYVIALDEKTAKELWRTKIDTLYTYKGNTYGDGPRSTPTIDGNCLYALSGNGQLVCVDITKKGAEVWKKHLIKDLGGVMMDRYGVSESVLIDGKHLICTPGGPKGTLAALDKTNGKEIWRSKDLKQTAPFASVIVAELQKKRQYIQTSYDATPGSEFGSISGFDPANGKMLWTGKIFNGTNDSNGIGTTPVVLKDQVYASSIIGGCHLFDIHANATDKYKKAQSKTFKNAHGGVVMIDGFIYGHDGKTWACQEIKDADIKWDARPALPCNSGSIVAAEGMLYLYTDEGTVGLVPANPNAFNLVSSFKLAERSKVPVDRTTSRMTGTWAHPVIANGHLYLRDHEFIFAYKITK